jgi:hypothetical protein
MRGLDPRIHQMKKSFEKMDCRVKPGNDNTNQNQRSPLKSCAGYG